VSDAEAGALGHPRLHLRRTDSTNERARALAIAGAPHGTLVTAAEQTAGRGRQGRGWAAPAGQALLCSLVLRPSPPGCVPPTSDRSSGLLPLIAGVATCDVVGERARVKWPNDVVVERAGGGARTGVGGAPTLAKLAGILVEGRPQEGWGVLGIGLNVAVRIEQLPAGVRERAASLELPASAIEPHLERLVEALERRLAQPAESVLDEWRERDALLDRDISWNRGHGVARGIDDAGRLIVTLADSSTTTLAAGEVHLEPA
jgi:BirA family biotin operon repressor/biotin-[acetyl-CoA-carboxylase] ligase